MGVRCQGNSEPPADGATTPLSACHAWLRNAAWLGPPYTIPSGAHQQCIYTVCVYIVGELHQEAGGQRGAGKERGTIEGGMDGGSKGREGGREGGSDDVRQRGSGSGGREGRLREG